MRADELAETTTTTSPSASEDRAAPATVASTVRGLQRTVGNSAVSGLILGPGVAGTGTSAGQIRLLQRCIGSCKCGGDRNGAPEHLEMPSHSGEALAVMLREAVIARTLARQHDPGGPYHPPEGTPLACSMGDSCSEVSTKINYLKHTIKRHQEWDQANPDPRWPAGRHALEIADLERALANCVAIASIRCRGQPRWIPVPVPRESPEERAERVRRQLYDALPWAVAVVVVALVVACVIAEPCGAAVLAAVAAVGGAEALAVVTAILVANGVMTEEGT